MKPSFFLFVIIIAGMMMCSAAPDDLQSIRKDLEDDTRYYPASVEAIEISYKRCLNRILSDMKESIEIDKSMGKSNGILELIECYEKLSNDGLYHIWGMGGGLFMKLQKEYEDAPLFFFDSSEALEESGVLINHLEGIGIRIGDKMKVLSTSDEHLTSPSFAVFDFSALEEFAKEILQQAPQEGVDITAKEAPLNQSKALTAKDKEVLGAWRAYAERLESKSNSIFEKKFSKDARELEMSNVEIKAIASFPFIEYLNQYLNTHIHSILSSLKKEILERKQGKTDENIEKDFRWRIENELEVSSVSPPLGMSKGQWRTIVRESAAPNTLWFYRRTIKYQDYELQNEVGFVIKQNAKIVRKIPLNIDIISYTLPE